jgi:predicted RNA-binding Zn ribbon-like protein
MVIHLDEEGFQLETGRLCLDFANTAGWHASAHPVEEINSYTDLVHWAQSVGLLDDSEAQRLLREASIRVEDSKSVLEKAVFLREAVYRTFSARARGIPPRSEDLGTINSAVAEAFPHLQITTQGESFQWKWTGIEGRLSWPLWPVALSTGKLLTSKEISRVGECADDRGCGRLFFDTSRNRTRRWCNMKDCGNRAKARRHYRRVKVK